MRRVKIGSKPVILVLPNGDEITAQALVENVMRLQQDDPGIQQHLLARPAVPHGISVWLG